MIVEAIKIAVDISGVVSGKAGYLNYSKNVKNIQKFLVEWENIGSVGCKVRMRVDIYKNESILYTAWSKEEALEPGDHTPLEAYWYPVDSGGYTANITIYHCNEIFSLSSMSFVVNRENTTKLPVEVDIKSDENNVYLRIKAVEDLKNLLIIPHEYPLGWIFEYGKLDEIKQGETRTVRIGYRASIWKSKPVSFIITDGRRQIIRNFILEKGVNYQELLFYPLLFLVILLTVTNIYSFKEKILLVIRKSWRKLC